MHLRRLLARAVLACVVVACTLSGSAAFAQSRYGRSADEPGRFDFYVLTLSWSPSYCEAEGDRRNDIQCERPFSFVVHGLWPQHDRGYPADCDARGQRVPERVLDTNTDIFPSKGLMIHEWRKHGTCSGLDPEAYFNAARALYKRVSIPASLAGVTAPKMVDPDAVEAEFRSANAGLAAEAIAVTCDNRRLREVRICYKRDLSGYVACPEVDRAACRANRTYLPAVRGR